MLVEVPWLVVTPDLLWQQGGGKASRWFRSDRLQVWVSMVLRYVEALCCVVLTSTGKWR